ncbi:MAG: hypothetical protein ACKOEO_06895, partial [Planctomycetaceae bacterium]
MSINNSHFQGLSARFVPNWYPMPLDIVVQKHFATKSAVWFTGSFCRDMLRTTSLSRQGLGQRRRVLKGVFGIFMVAHFDHSSIAGRNLNR